MGEASERREISLGGFTGESYAVAITSHKILNALHKLQIRL